MNAIELAGVVKDYRGLRPLRVRDLRIEEGELVTISGLDLPATEVLTGLITGLVLPDAGTVRVFGQDTAAVADADSWLAALDRFGVVSGRVTLLDGFSVQQNIAIPLTLELDVLPHEVVERIGEVADRVGLPRELLPAPAGTLAASMQFRLRLARAVVAAPRVLVVEHPAGSLPVADLRSAAATIRAVVTDRRVTTLVIGEDAESRRIADRHLSLDASTGVLRPSGTGRWFS